jgi:hypothetical protein
MKAVQIDVQPWLLRARLAAMRAGPAACAAAVLCVAGLAGWGWSMRQHAALQTKLAYERAHPVSSVPATLAVAAPPPTADENLAAFYAVLGEKREAEQYVKVLFGLAGKAGLSLSQGEYKFGYDKASRVTTYQVVLPVRGAYQPIWQFALEALRALPFASLDDIGFRRDTISDTQVEARVRLTFYLKDAP